MATQGGLPVRAVFKTFKGPCKAYWPIGLYFPCCSWRASLVSALRASMWLLLEALPDCPLGPWFYRPHYQGFGASVKEFQKAFRAAQGLRRHIRNWDQGSPWGGAGHGGELGLGDLLKPHWVFLPYPHLWGYRERCMRSPRKQEQRRINTIRKSEGRRRRRARRKKTNAG